MAIRKAEEKGRITKGEDGLYELGAAIEEWNATTQHEKGHNNRSPKLPDIPTVEIPKPEETRSTAYAKARAATQVSEALTKRLRYERLAMTLTPTADVENARFTEFRTLREACFNIPARVAAILAGESSVEKCQQLLEAELDSVFTAFSEGKLAA
jgi:hypothetical protein